MNKKNVIELRQYTKDCIVRYSLNSTNYLGEEPRYPMIICYMGEASTAAYEDVSSELYQLWPSFHEHILHFCIDYKEDESALTYKLLSKEGSRDISEQELLKNLNLLHDEDSGFESVDRINMYFIMDSSKVLTLDEYLKQLGLYKLIKEKLRNITARDMLFLLLNEGLDRSAVSIRIKNHLAKYYEEEGRSLYSMDTVFIISNKRSDGHIVRNFEKMYSIISYVIAQSNQKSDVHTISMLYSGGLKCVSFSRVSKPLDDISLVIIQSFLRQLREHNQRKPSTQMLSEKRLKELAGINEEGVFKCIEDYINTHKSQYEVTEEFLEYFPRKEMDAADISRLSYEDADELTMGTVSGYVSTLVYKALGSFEAQGVPELVANYRRYINKSCKSKEELLELRDNINTLKRLISEKADRFIGNTGVIDVVSKRLTYELSDNQSIREEIFKVIEDEARNSQSFERSFEELINALDEMRSISDTSIKSMYGNIADRYVYENMEGINEEFRRLRSDEDFYMFAKRHIGEIIKSHDIFRLNFEDELRERLNKNDDPTYIDNWLYSRLTSIDEVPIYLRSTFGTFTPLGSIFSLRTDTRLSDYIRKLLTGTDKTTYYYNTRSNSYAIAMEIFKVEASNIISQEEDN